MDVTILVDLYFRTFLFRRQNKVEYLPESQVVKRALHAFFG
jgi:hypothetical protein